MSTRVDLALQTALRFHEGQTRKETDIPYVTHPVAVALELATAGCSEDEIIAGILHDTVEDTELKEDDIKKVFGNEVARIVRGCSEPEKSLPWKERKEHTIHYLKTAPADICRVVVADKFHNLSTIENDLKDNGDCVWDRFNKGKDEQAWYYRSICDVLLQNEHFPNDFLPFSELRILVKNIFE